MTAARLPCHAAQIADTATDVNRALFVNELEKIRHLDQLRKQNVVRGRYTEEELAELEQRADKIIAGFPQGYFDKSFDPVAHELSQLGDNDNQEEIDAIVERLTLGVEVSRAGCKEPWVLCREVEFGLGKRKPG